jgi:hypothetical protein
MQDQLLPAEGMGPGFRPVRLVMVVLAVLLLIFIAGGWYMERASLLRYCHQPELALQRLAAVVTSDRPAREQPTYEYVVAAKLEFLVPRAADEPVEHYLRRVRIRLEQECL